MLLRKIIRQKKQIILEPIGIGVKRNGSVNRFVADCPRRPKREPQDGGSRSDTHKSFPRNQKPLKFQRL